MVAQYKGILHRILQADPGDSVRTRIRPFAEGMICACDEVDLVFRQGDGFIFELCSRKGDNGHVKLSFQQKVLQLQAVRLHHIHVHIRILFGKQPQNLRQGLLAAERTDAQGNAAAFHPLAVPKLAFGLLIIVQKMPQMVDEDFTVGSRADALGGTEKEFDAELVFILREKLAETGLGHVEPVRCLRNTAFFRQRDQVLKVFQVHNRRSFPFAITFSDTLH